MKGQPEKFFIAVLSILICDRLKSDIDNIISPYQCGRLNGYVEPDSGENPCIIVLIASYALFKIHNKGFRCVAFGVEKP